MERALYTRCCQEAALSVLNCQYIMFTYEIDQLRQAIDWPEGLLGRLIEEREIERMGIASAVKVHEATISAIDEWAYRLAYRKAADVLPSFSTPIHRLPPKVLQLIFVAVIEGRSLYCDSDMMDRRTAVRLVCRSWRDVVESVPALWVPIYISPILFGLSNSYAQSVETAFRLAKGSDLRVEWDSGTEDLRQLRRAKRRAGGAEVQGFIESVISSRRQWSALSLRATWPTYTECLSPAVWPTHILDADGRDLPGLQILTLRDHGPSDRDGDRPEFTFQPLFLMPNLRNLEMFDCNLRPDPLISLLRALPTLSSLKVHPLKFDVPQNARLPGGDHSVPLFQLVHLSFQIEATHTGSDDPLGSWFVRQIECPQLGHLEIDTRHRPRAPKFDLLPRTIADKKWSIDTLDIGTPWFSRESSIVLLSSMESVHRLRVGDQDDLAGFASVATMELENPLLPELRELIVHGSCDTNLAFKWIESRYRVYGSLLFRLSSCGFSSTDLNAMRRLKARVVIQEYNKSQPIKFPPAFR